MLPEKDGFQVLKDLRAKESTTPVLIMTAKESLDDKGHGFELGADDYLTKPFYLEELKMRIQRSWNALVNSTRILFLMVMWLSTYLAKFNHEGR